VSGVAVALLVLTLDGLMSSVTHAFGATIAPWATSLGLAAAAATIPRLRFPVAVAVVVVGLDLWLLAIHTTVGQVPFAVGVVIYTLAAQRSVRSGWIAAAATVLLALVVGQGLSLYLVILAMTCALATLSGNWIGARRRYLATLVELAERLAVERDQQGALAAAAERTRIAREMHDIVAHGLSVMIRLSDGAGAIAQTDPERAAEANRLVAETGRASLAELRRVLGVLRDGELPRADQAPRADQVLRDGDAPEPVPLAPQPSLDDLDELIERYRAAGLPVAIRRQGDTDGVSAGVGLVVYRAVQEALTNTLRYAGHLTRVQVDIDVAEAVMVQVTDDGSGSNAAPAPDHQGAGRGLLGLRERAAAHGGTVTAGPVDPTGWAVRVTIPRDESTT
jgi:signal transduction histidine kinase